MLAAMTRKRTGPDRGFVGWLKARMVDEFARRLSATAFAKRVGLDPETVIAWTERDVQPQRTKLRLLADYFGESEDELLWLAGFDVQPPVGRQEPRRYARVVEGVAASAGPDSLWMTGAIELPPGIPGHADYILVVRVTGDCLSPEIESGEYVYVDSSKLSPPSGAKVVLRAEDGEIMVKRVVELDGERLLIDNRGRVYQPNGGQVLGTVVGVVKIEGRR